MDGISLAFGTDTFLFSNDPTSSGPSSQSSPPQQNYQQTMEVYDKIWNSDDHKDCDSLTQSTNENPSIYSQVESYLNPVLFQQTLYADGIHGGGHSHQDPPPVNVDNLAKAVKMQVTGGTEQRGRLNSQEYKPFTPAQKKIQRTDRVVRKINLYDELELDKL